MTARKATRVATRAATRVVIRAATKVAMRITARNLKAMPVNLPKR